MNNTLQTFEIKGETWDNIKEQLKRALQAAAETISQWLSQHNEYEEVYETHLHVNGSDLTLKALGFEKVAYAIYENEESVWINTDYIGWKELFIRYVIEHVEKALEKNKK